MSLLGVVYVIQVAMAVTCSFPVIDKRIGTTRYAVFRGQELGNWIPFLGYLLMTKDFIGRQHVTLKKTSLGTEEMSEQFDSFERMYIEYPFLR